MGLKRIDKLIALNCNVSRKDARKLIKDGAVTVNSRVCLRAEELVDADVDDITVKGYNFTAKDHVYIMLNRPTVSLSCLPAGKRLLLLSSGGIISISVFLAGSVVALITPWGLLSII